MPTLKIDPSYIVKIINSRLHSNVDYYIIIPVPSTFSDTSPIDTKDSADLEFKWR